MALSELSYKISTSVQPTLAASRSRAVTKCCASLAQTSLNLCTVLSSMLELMQSKQPALAASLLCWPSTTSQTRPMTSMLLPPLLPAASPTHTSPMVALATWPEVSDQVRNYQALVILISSPCVIHTKSKLVVSSMVALIFSSLKRAWTCCRSRQQCRHVVAQCLHVVALFPFRCKSPWKPPDACWWVPRLVLHTRHCKQ